MYARRKEQCTFKKDVFPEAIKADSSVGYRDESFVHSRPYEVDKQFCQDNTAKKKCEDFLKGWEQFSNNIVRQKLYERLSGVTDITPLEVMFPRLLNNPYEGSMYGDPWVQPAELEEVLMFKEECKQKQDPNAGLVCFLPGPPFCIVYFFLLIGLYV